MKALVDLGWSDESGTERMVPKGETVPQDAPKEKVDFWKAVGMVDAKKDDAKK